MTRVAAVCGLTLCALALAGCKHDRRKAVAASYSSVTRPTPVVAAPLSAIGIASIPVEEEYEVRSAIAITSADLPERVSEIEKELR
jgi:DNA primase